MSLRLTILGCHSATPRVNAFPTSQYLEINDRHFIIDCGEGTQRQMRKYKVGYSKINHIFISHLHYDTLILLIQIAGLLLFARLMGELAQRVGQPAVVGEIFAGILLGPTLIGNVPIVAEYMVPNDSGRNYLTIISMLGAMFLLFIAGMETDIKLIKVHSKNAIKIAATALLQKK